MEALTPAVSALLILAAVCATFLFLPPVFLLAVSRKCATLKAFRYRRQQKADRVLNFAIECNDRFGLHKWESLSE